MKILVACEESQRVCTAFRNLGNEAYSCDIEPCSGGHEEWHIKSDVKPLLDGNCEFTTMDGTHHIIAGRWDVIIAFPPCTYLTVAGNRYYSTNLYSHQQVTERIYKRYLAFKFFVRIWNAKCDKICIENPVGYMNTHWQKPTQIIQPYFFASGIDDTDNYVQKRTCLWLKGLSPLQRTNDLPKPKPKYYSQGEKTMGKAIGWCDGMNSIKGGDKERSKARSKTFPAIANAMARQWGLHDILKGD